MENKNTQEVKEIKEVEVNRGKVEMNLPLLKLSTFNVEVEGISDLLMHKFSDESKKQMMDKQMGKSKEKMKPRDIKQEIASCIHKLPNGKVGFPAIGFKKAMVEAAVYFDNMNKKLIKGSLHVMGNLTPIKFSKQEVNESVVRLDSGVRMVRYRPAFKNWKAMLVIKYNQNIISPQQIITLLDYAGFHIGVGDWTPQHNGQFGMFRVKRKIPNK